MSWNWEYVVRKRGKNDFLKENLVLSLEGRSSYCDSLFGKVGESVFKFEFFLWSVIFGVFFLGVGFAFFLLFFLRVLRLLVDFWGFFVVCMIFEILV